MTQAVKAQFLEHSSKHNTSISVYTDGFKSKQSVGSAAVFNGKMIKRKLPSLCSNFTAEAYAILLAVKEIYYSCSNEQSLIIYTDSNSVLASLQQLLPTHPLVQEVQDWLVLVHSRKRTKVNFCWVPGHTGVMGNETADKASKSAVADLQPTTAVHIPHGDLKKIIHTHIQNKWQHRWSTLTDNLKLKKIRPFIKKWESSNCPNRRNNIILTRLRIGHTHLTHNFLMTGGDERQVPFCRTCQAHITVQHI
ncbi:ribonuclease H-like [Oratosquilla oratoria]|uniref:ribonuclease H-like n=1 Tax=Oratosquilla oratoria TaxID=337810 RepID=UPI003F7768C1